MGETVKPYSSSRSASEDAKPRPGKSLGQLGADFLTLVELQVELAQADCHQALNKARLPSFLICIGIACAIGACPVAMLGLAWGLASATGLSVAVSSLIVALVGLILAAALFYVAWKQFMTSVSSFNRSSEEFRNNVNWIKHVFAKRRE